MRKSALLKCGILSVVNKTASHASPITIDTFKKALKKLDHRGPDDFGIFHKPHQPVIMGHTRLSIIDIAGGHQPLSSPDNLVHVIVNGELYDFERIRSELESKHGYRFKTQSDSEIALHLYLEYGMSFLEHLRGEFAIIIWDQRHDMVFAIRDRFGIKPLYFCETNGQLMLGSEAKALLDLGIQPRWNANGMASASHICGSGSIFEGIQQVPPGQYLQSSTKSSERAKLTRYWEYSYADRNVPEKRTTDEMILQVREKLLESIKLRLRSDVPVGVYLSGGLDSCSVLGMASHLSKGQKIKAFTISFEESSEHDEYKQALNMAKMWGADFNRITVTSNNITDALESSIYHTELPTNNTHGAAKFLLSKAVRDSGMKVVLTGEGSDEIFAGYSFYRIDSLLSDESFRNSSPDTQKELIGQIINRNKFFFNSMAQIQKPPSPTDRLFMNSMGFNSYGRSFWKNFSISQTFIRDDLKVDPDFVFFSNIPGDIRESMRNRWEPLSSVQYIENKTLLPNYLLTVLGDRNEMANSIEARVPFLDHELVDLVNHMPSSVKVHHPEKAGSDLIEKWILKEAAKPFVTQEIYERQKHPFLAPPALFHPNSRLMEWVKERIYSRDMENVSWLDGKRVKTFADNVISQVNIAHANPNGGLNGSLATGQIDMSDLTMWDSQLLNLASIASLQRQFSMSQ